MRERRWLAEALEALPLQKTTNEEKLKMLDLMATAESLDHFMQKRYPSVKRYAY